MFLIIAVMFIAGVFGGFVNFYLAKPDDVPTPSRARSVVVGLAASFLVPLFLNMISSNLIELIRAGDNAKLLILLGFCLVAAISSTAFIRTLSDRVLSEAKQAKKEALEAKAEVSEAHEVIQTIAAKETEPDLVDSATAPDERAGAEPTTTEEKLLKALSGGRWALRSESGLTKEIAADRAEVARALQELRGRGLVGRRAGERGTRWFITESGRAALMTG
jgi:hypothetical protein